MTSTITRSRKTHRAHKANPATEARQAEVELAITQVNDESPDFAAFIARWGDRYSASNLHRLWVQCPRATALHKFGTWRGMGRQVRKGEHAIWLRIPHTSHDDDRITAENPTGEIFTGAPWMGLFDISQTSEIGEFDETAPDASPEQADELKRLRAAAIALHPDTTGEDTGLAFSAAWLAYEAARDACRSEQS